MLQTDQEAIREDKKKEEENSSLWSNSGFSDSLRTLAVRRRSRALPRNLESHVLWALPVAVLKFPKLHLSEARLWLAQRNMFGPDDGERELHACLIAFAGRGLIFLDGTDPADELRFSLATRLATSSLIILSRAVRPLRASVQK